MTDDAMLLERIATVVAVAGDPMNFKITTMLDLARAGGTDGRRACLRRGVPRTRSRLRRPSVRDRSRAVARRRAVRWRGRADGPFRRRLRSVTRSPDALLGASALGDVGEHFPSPTPRSRGSRDPPLLRPCRGAARRGGVHAVLVRRDGRRRPARDRAAPSGDRSRLAEILAIPIDRISVKATRPEGLGLAGDGIGCLAVAVVT